MRSNPYSVYYCEILHLQIVGYVLSIRTETLWSHPKYNRVIGFRHYFFGVHFIQKPRPNCIARKTWITDYDLSSLSERSTKN